MTFGGYSPTPFQVGWMGSLTTPGALAFRLSQRMECKGFQTPRSWWSQNILCLLFRPGHASLVPNRFSTTEPEWQSRQASCHPCHPCPSLAKVIRSHLAYWDRTLNVSQTSSYQKGSEKHNWHLLGSNRDGLMLILNQTETIFCLVSKSVSLRRFSFSIWPDFLVSAVADWISRTRATSSASCSCCY